MQNQLAIFVMIKYQIYFYYVCTAVYHVLEEKLSSIHIAVQGNDSSLTAKL